MSRRPAWVIALFGFGLGVLVLVSAGGLPTAAGQPKPLVVPPSPQAPTLTSPATLGMKRGITAELVLTGTNLADPTSVLLSCQGKVTIVEDKKPDPAKITVKVELPAEVPLGMHSIRVATKQGVSNLRPFLVDELTSVAEADGNKTKDTAQTVSVPCVVSGRTDAESSDYFRVKVATGQTLTFEVLARRVGSPLDPIVVLHDAKTKRELINLYADDTPGLQSDCRLTHTFKQDGEVLVEVRDTTYRGGADFYYRLRIGEFPGATTAFPLVVQRGKDGKVGFAGPGAEELAAVPVRVPPDHSLAAVYAVPHRSSGVSGWPLSIRVSDDPQTVEQEPNDTTAKATKVLVPGGVSAKFGTKGDIDHFAVAGKKGQKLIASVLTYEVNAPTEVLIRVVDSKGAELAKSNPATVPVRVEFTPADDGPCTIICEHMNYLFGPNEVYHVAVAPATADFAVALALDRYEATAGGGTAVAVTNVARLNGYAGPVELSIEGNSSLSGKATVAAGQTQAFIPLNVKSKAKVGAYPFRVKATAMVDGKEVVRFATLTDLVKANLGGMPNPPLDLLQGCAVAVVEKPAFSLTFTPEPKAFEKGKAGKLLVEAQREKGADADIAIALLFAPPNVTPALKPVPKGQTKAEVGITVAPAAAVGPSAIVLKATTKIGGKDYAVTGPPVGIEVVEAKKVEPKKDDTKKKEEPKKKKE